MLSSQQKEKLIVLANCLVEFIDKDYPNTNDYNVLYFLAKNTIKRLESSDDLANIKFTSREILQGVIPDSEETNSSKWLNPIYKRIDEKLKASIEEPLSNFAAENGLNSFLWITKSSTEGGRGNTSQYWLEEIPIKEGSRNHTTRYIPKKGEIKYTAVREFDASLIAKIIYRKDLSLTGWRKWLLIFYPIASVIFMGLFIYIVFLAWFISPKPITTRTLSEICMIIIGIWIAYKTKESSDRFVDDRIIMASEWFTQIRESGVIQEMVTVSDGNNNFVRKDIRLIKYVSLCDVCGAQVYLAKGEPDYPTKVIGRCKENPREHIYSFDRVTLIGRTLN